MKSRRSPAPRAITPACGQRCAAPSLTDILTLLDLLYPALRIYLFDARWVYSAPITVFGPLLAVVYIGRHYLAFREADRVASLSAQFDRLIREAAVGARDLPDYLRRLRIEIE